MNIGQLRKTWSKVGADDPLWAVLTDPQKRRGKWDLEEFFAIGRDEVTNAIQYAKGLEVYLGNKRALDFGCGVGRLTLPLAEHYQEVVGVDISEPMLEKAKHYAGDQSRCQFIVNTEANLRIFPDDHFEFIYSNITLQHMEPRYAKAYLREFVRVLTPRGLLLFQLPTVRLHGRPRRSWKSIIPKRIRYWLFFTVFHRVQIEMHGMPVAEVKLYLEEHGGRVIDTVPNQYAGPTWHSVRYAVTKE